jgi:hypothetical protein
MECTYYPEKKKGPLAMASGPSLGRKRPRRAAIARGATAPQQYATALHKVQGFSNRFPCNFRKSGRTVTGPSFQFSYFDFNSLAQMQPSASACARKILDFVIACGNAAFARPVALFSIQNASR